MTTIDRCVLYFCFGAILGDGFIRLVIAVFAR